MKTLFKSSLILAGALALAASGLRAEDTPPPPPPPADHPQHEHGPGGPGGRGAMMERVAKELNLTADQQAQWKEIGQQERTAMEAIWADATLSKEDRRAKAMDTNKTFGEQRRAVLTPEQQTKFDELRAKMRERGEHGPKKPKDE